MEHHFELDELAPDKTRMKAGLREVFETWERLCGAKDMPAWGDFDWMELPPQVIPWCAVVDVVNETPDFVYRFWGTARTRLQGRDYTGLPIRDVRPRELSDKIYKEYKNVWTQGKPIHFVTSDFDIHDGKKAEYHFLRLPFGDDGDRVTQIFAVGIYEEAEIKNIQNFFQEEL